MFLTLEIPHSCMSLNQHLFTCSCGTMMSLQRDVLTPSNQKILSQQQLAILRSRQPLPPISLQLLLSHKESLFPSLQRMLYRYSISSLQFIMELYVFWVMLLLPKYLSFLYPADKLISMYVKYGVRIMCEYLFEI